MTISDVVLVERAGFSIAEHMQGSDFEQVLRIAVLILPAMALATITRNVSSQVFTALGVLAVCALIGVVADGADVFTTIDWVYDSIAAIIIAGFATAVDTQCHDRLGAEFCSICGRADVACIENSGGGRRGD